MKQFDKRYLCVDQDLELKENQYGKGYIFFEGEDKRRLADNYGKFLVKNGYCNSVSVMEFNTTEIVIKSEEDLSNLQSLHAEKK
jgi:hypothetical protein